MTDTPIIAPGENPAETMRKVMEGLTGHTPIDTTSNPQVFTTPTLIEMSKDRRDVDLTELQRNAAEYFKPARRQGTAKLDDLDSLINWAKRFQGDSSVLYAKPDMTAPSLTCIADYHDAGPATVDDPAGDPTARHGMHRATYSFPLHDDWKAWNRVSGTPLDKDEMGEFIEAHAMDILEPTPAMLALRNVDENAPWENRLIDTARHIEGRYGQLRELLAMSRQFQVYETSDLKVTKNRDTGEESIQFLNEHKDADGAPLKIPNLIMIAVPVFRGGIPYRMAVRFRYRKSGSTVKFILSIYNPEKAFEAAFDEAIETAQKATELPLFKGQPEG